MTLTDIQRLRLAIGDSGTGTDDGVKPDGSHFTDEELQAFLDDASDANKTWRSAVAPVLISLAAQYSAMSRNMQFADFREDFRNVAQELRRQARAWEARINDEGEDVEPIRTSKLSYSSMFTYNQ